MFSTTLKTTTAFAVTAAVMTLMPEVAMAQNTGAGQGILTDFQDAMTGNLGTIGGLAISLFGLYKWIMDQETWGIMMLIGGALITAFPSIFTSVGQGVNTALDATGVQGAGQGANQR